jgi:hypothetical protein
VNLVIKNPTFMKKLLEFLIVQLKTINGKRGSAIEYINQVLGKKAKASDKKSMLNTVYLQTFKHYTLLKVRMKISFSAMMK